VKGKTKQSKASKNQTKKQRRERVKKLCCSCTVAGRAAAAGSEQRLLICCSLGVSKQKIRQATAKGKGEAGPGLGFE
jgi:hypothetical protein